MILPTENFRSLAAIARFVLTTIVGLALDLLTKYFAFAYLRGPKVVIPGWLHFEKMTNRGAVFGIGQEMTILFLSISIVAILFLTYLFATSGKQRWFQVLLGILLAGVLGNMYDRIEFGYVRDMIHALPGRKWPGTWNLPGISYPGRDREIFPWIFNVADILLCVGVFFMIVHSAFSKKPAGKDSPEKESKSPVTQA